MARNMKFIIRNYTESENLKKWAGLRFTVETWTPIYAKDWMKCGNDMHFCDLGAVLAYILGQGKGPFTIESHVHEK